jgi:hypothetical protein
MYKILFRRIFSTYACTEKDETYHRILPNINGFASLEMRVEKLNLGLQFAVLVAVGPYVQNPVPAHLFDICLHRKRTTPVTVFQVYFSDNRKIRSSSLAVRSTASRALYVQDPVPAHLFDKCLHRQERHLSQDFAQIQWRYLF